MSTEFKHSVSEPIPNDVGSLAWFSCYGSYGVPPTYDNWGHVVSFVPGKGFLSSPAGALGTYGQAWFDTISEVEQAFNARFVGWSEDINGLRVSQIVQQKTSIKDVSKMMLCHKPQADGSLLFLLFSDGFYLEFTGQESANAFAGQIGSSSAPVTQSFFDKVKLEVDAKRK